MFVPLQKKKQTGTNTKSGNEAYCWKNNYQESLKITIVPTLKKRRDMICARFATKCVQNENTNKAYFSTKKSQNETKKLKFPNYKCKN